MSQPSLERRRLRLYLVLVLGDLSLLLMAFVAAGLLYTGTLTQGRSLTQGQLLIPLFYTIALYNNTYSARVLTDLRFALRQAFVALIISAALLNFVTFYTKSSASFSRATFTIGLVLSFLLITLLRAAMVWAVEKVWNGKVRNNLILDDGGPSFHLEHAALLSTVENGLEPTRNDPYLLDRMGKLLRNQDKVVVSCPRERRAAWAFLLKSAGVQGEIVSEPAHEIGAIGVIQYEGQERTTLIVSAGPLGLRARAFKRIFDIVVAIGGLIVLSPILAWTALCIKLEDGGPVFFHQRRLGRGNRFFDMIKFRSMKVEGSDQEGARSTEREDDRITRIGKTIRSNSIDELPQLWNVLRGDMSIVGPRPHALGSQANNKYFWEVDGRYWKRHSLKPGLTGLAQIRGHRGSTAEEKDLTDRLQSDLEYINGWSLRRDLGIVIGTLRVLRHDRAF